MVQCIFLIHDFHQCDLGGFFCKLYIVNKNKHYWNIYPKSINIIKKVLQLIIYCKKTINIHSILSGMSIFIGISAKKDWLNKDRIIYPLLQYHLQSDNR